MDNQKLIHQLFIGKVADEIGFEKTIELLKEANKAFDVPENPKSFTEKMDETVNINKEKMGEPITELSKRNDGNEDFVTTIHIQDEYRTNAKGEKFKVSNNSDVDLDYVFSKYDSQRYRLPKSFTLKDWMKANNYKIIKTNG